jgi:hypothetical protein
MKIYLDPSVLFKQTAAPTPQQKNVKVKKQKPDFADYVKFFEEYQKFQKFLKDNEKKEEKKEDKDKKIDPWKLVIILTAAAPAIGLAQILIASIMFKQIGALFH